MDRSLLEIFCVSGWRQVVGIGLTLTVAVNLSLGLNFNQRRKCLQLTESESELEESWRELNASAGFEFALLSSLRAAWLPSSSRFKPMTKKGALANLEETLKIRINLRNSKRNISSWMSLRATWLPFSSRFKLMTKKKRHRILILRFGNNFDIFKGRSIR